MRYDWKFFTAIASGFITGTIAGLLYAPTDGKTMRKNITDVVADKTEKTQQLMLSAKHSYQTTTKIAGFQIERLYASVNAGIEEARLVKKKLEQRAREFEHKDG